MATERGGVRRRARIQMSQWLAGCTGLGMACPAGLAPSGTGTRASPRGAPTSAALSAGHSASERSSRSPRNSRSATSTVLPRLSLRRTTHQKSASGIYSSELARPGKSFKHVRFAAQIEHACEVALDGCHLTPLRVFTLEAADVSRFLKRRHCRLPSEALSAFTCPRTVSALLRPSAST